MDSIVNQEESVPHLNKYGDFRDINMALVYFTADVLTRERRKRTAVINKCHRGIVSGIDST